MSGNPTTHFDIQKSDLKVWRRNFPVQVVSLLENMKQELVAEGEQEQQNFDKFLGREPKKTVIHWAKQK